MLDQFFSPEVRSMGRGLLEGLANLSPEHRQFRLQQEEMRRRGLLQEQEMAMRKAQFDAQQAERQATQQAAQKRAGYLDSVSPSMGPAMPFDPAQALLAGLTKDDISLLNPEAKKADSPFAKINPADYTPESFTEFVRTNDYGKLVPYRKPDNGDELVRVLRAAGIDPNSPEGKDFMRKRAVRLTTEPGPQTVVMGSPVPIQMPDGTQGYVQPANRPGVAPQVLTIGGVPAKRPPEGGGAASEDERKAAGWYSQASNAYRNMLRALEEDNRASKPSIATDIVSRVPLIGEPLANAAKSPTRQKFEQAASSFAEAALRAATGAGVTEQEARQKIKELTPQVGDSDGVIAQKANDMRVYLDSLRLRAGRAMNQMQPPAAPSGSAPSINELLQKYGGK